MKIQKQHIMSYKNFELLSNDIISLAKEIMPDKVIYINFLNDEVQVTMKVSRHDTKVNVFEGDEIPVENAVCNNIDYENEKPLILEDIKNNTFNEKVNQTIKEGNLGSYLGIPILFKDGKRFGALCAAHHREGSFDHNDIELLKKIANLFSYYLELERQALVDSLTNLYNTRFLYSNQYEIINDGGLVIMLDLDNFKLVNDTLGHHTGDLVLKEFGEKINEFARQFHFYYTIRLGGDEFFIYIKDKLDNKTINNLLTNFNNDLKKWYTNIENIKLTSSIGAYKFGSNKIDDFTILYEKVDSLLYQAKTRGKDQYIYKSLK